MARVLVVEDDEDIRATLEIALEDAGYDVRTAGNGRDALTSVLAEPPNAIVLDLMMPVMHGWELVETLRAHPALGHLPIIVTSATGDAVPRNADWVLHKPYDLDELIHAVERVRTHSPMEHPPAS
jgi:CheY-like chemotaxis protein